MKGKMQRFVEARRRNRKRQPALTSRVPGSLPFRGTGSADSGEDSQERARRKSAARPPVYPTHRGTGALPTTSIRHQTATPRDESRIRAPSARRAASNRRRHSS